jgi:iron-sulfur cluster repair protein YtfE (RIC family)
MPHFDFSARATRSAWLAACPEAVTLIGGPEPGADPTLEAIAQGQGLEPEVLLHRLALTCKGFDEAGEPDRDWTSASMDELIDHLAGQQHPRLFAELGRTLVLLRHRTCNAALAEDLRRWIADKRAHMREEERELFPLCRDLSRARPESFSAERALRIMYVSHEQSGLRLAAICQRMAEDILAGRADLILKKPLEAIVRILDAHIELENAVLLPAVIFASDVARSQRLRAGLAALEATEALAPESASAGPER